MRQEPRATVVHARDRYLTLKALARRGLRLCVDLTAVDYLGHPGRMLPTATPSGSRSSPT